MRSDKPVTKEAFDKKHLFVDLSSSAHSIYYMLHAGATKGLDFYVRYDVAPEDLDLAVEKIIFWGNAQVLESQEYPRRSLSEAPPPPTPKSQYLPMPWWDPDTIVNGYYRGTDEPYGLMIYVDQDRSRIYFYQHG